MGGKNGSLQAGATFAPGKVSQAFAFNGGNYVRVPANSSFNIPGAFTIDTWFRGTPTNNFHIALVDKSHGFVDNRGWVLQFFGGYLNFALGTGTNFLLVPTNSNVLDGKFHHVAGVFDGTSIRIYLDGVLQNVTPLGSATYVDNNRDLYIGAAWGGGSPQRGFNGLVDEVELFNRALSQAEIQALYNASSAGKCNVAPLAHDQFVTTGEDTPKSITLGATDSDGNFLDYSVVVGPSHGVLSGTAPNLTYTPNTNYNGSDSFTFKANDGFGDSNTATVSITVNPSNDPPVAVCQNVTKTVAACPVAVSAGEVNNNSSDADGDTLTYSLSPAGPFSPGTTNVTLTATDPSGASSSCTATVTIIDNTPPTISCPAGTTVSANSSCQAAVPDVLAGVTASDGCTASGSLIKTQSPAAGTLVGLGVTTITVTVQDAANNTSTCTTTFTVQDTTPPVVPNLPGSPQTFNWVQVNIPGSTPSARYGHAMVYDSTRAKVIMFGGQNAQGVNNNEVWELDSASNTWTNVTPATGSMPSPRFYAGMAYDVSSSKVLIYGGQVSNIGPGIAGDTWEWDPATHTWMAKPSASLANGPRLGSGMAYDPNLHQVILFGGRNFSSFGHTLTGTYAWNGTTWQQLNTPVGPIGRYTQGMATDFARSKVVMFGGYNGNLLGDTWEWNGSNWTLVAANGSGPFMRSGPGLAYDSARQRTVMFGGNTGQPAADTWEWNGTNWTQLQTQANPSARSSSMVYDSAQSKLVIFSGDGFAQFADTWYSQTTSGLPTITGECSASVTAPIATDNCAGPVTATTADPTTYNAQGTYTVHWTYNDGNGNSSTQNQTVIVKDTTSPTLTTPPNVSATTGAGAASCGLVISDFTLGTATASDNCGGVTVTRSGVPAGNNFPVGITTITYTATDLTGHTASATQTVTVIDNTPPQISNIPSAPGVNDTWSNVSVSGPHPSARSGHQMVYDSARKKVILFGGQTTQGSLFGGQDLSGQLLNDMWEWDGAARTWTQITPASGPLPPARSFFGMAYDPLRGRVVVYGGKVAAIYYSTSDDTWEWDPATQTWAAFPSAGSITYGGLRAPQMAYDPTSQQTILFGGIMYWGGHNGQTWAWNGTQWTLRSSAGPSGRIGHGMTTDFGRSRVVLFGGYDYTGNNYAGLFDTDTWEWNGTSWTSVATSGPGRRIGVGLAYDNARGVSVLFGGTYGGASNDPPVFNDTWEWNGTIWSLRGMQASPPPRDTVLAFDGSTIAMFGGRQGGTTTLDDTWLIALKSQIEVRNDPGQCSAVVNFAMPTATDNCPGATIVTSPSSGSVFPVGATPVTVTATDSAGNTSTRSFTVTVLDAEAPRPDLPSLPDVTGECSANLPPASTASDACDGRITGVPDKTGPFGQGDHTIIWTFTDRAGNIATQTQKVIVKDVTKPVPALATLPDVTGECSATIPAAPTANDNCSGVITGTTSDALSYTTQGEHIVTWGYDDGHGNESTQTQTVVVKDKTAPVLEAVPADTTVECDAVPPAATVTASDNCDGTITPVFSQKRVDGDCPSNYTLTRTWTATDKVGNSSIQSQVITVHDTTNPTISTPPTSKSVDADDHCEARLPDFTAGVVANDNCSTVTLTQNPIAGTSMPLGHNPVRVTATDACGNATSVEVFFDVTDNTPPSITCPANIAIVDNVPGSCGALVNPGTPTTSDNCGIQSVVGVRSDSKPLTDLYPVGTTTITWTATDNSNNKTSCTQTVTVTNPGPTVVITGPVIPQAVNTPVNFTATFADNAGDTHTAVWTFDGTPQAGTVNEGTQTVTTTYTFTAVGPHLVTLTVTDDCGQTVAANTSVLVYAYATETVNGSFVIGDGNAAVGTQVTFWGSQWAKENTLSQGSVPSGFKGFANTTSTTPPNCGGTWTTDPGNSSDPPVGIPTYVAVYVSSSVTTSGSTISGTIRRMVVVKTDPGYDSNPGHDGTGTVVAVICQ